MNFLFPGFLFALAALAVPVIIHLFRFRRFKKVYFTNVSLLQEVEITRRNRQKIKHLLVLLMRILAVSAVVLAFAKPFRNNVPGAGNAGTRLVSVYVDNSFSMDREGESGNLLNRAKQMAEEIAEAYSPTDKFQLITNDFEGRHARFYARDEFLNLVAEIDLSPTGRTMSEVVNRQKDLLKRENAQGGGRIYLISDFPQQAVNLPEIKPDSSYSLYLLPLRAAKSANLYLDSVWLATPNTGVNIPLTLRYRIRNTGEADAEDISVKLFLNGEQKTPSQVTVPAGGSAQGDLFFTVLKTGPQAGKVSVEDNSSAFDNDFYFSFQVAEYLNLMTIHENGADPAPEKVFSGDDYFRVNAFRATSTDYSLMNLQNLVILNGLQNYSGGLITELKKYSDAGGNILLFPGSKTDLSTLNPLFGALGIPAFSSLREGAFKADRVNTEGTFFDDIFESTPKNPDLPAAYRYFPMPGAGNGEWVLRLNTGDPMFLYFTRANGSKVFVSTVPAEDASGNFHRHALFVPILLKTAFLSAQKSPLFYVAGSYSPAEVPIPPKTGRDEVLRWIHTESGVEFIPEQRQAGGKILFYPGEYLNEAGNYRIEGSTTINRTLAYNYPRTESNSESMSNENLKTEIRKAALPYAEVMNSADDTLRQTIRQKEQAEALWKWFLGAALLFLAAEMLMLRFWP
jgi:hypothetical protein